MKKFLPHLITFLLLYLAANTLLQCYFVYAMRDRAARSLAMAKESAQLREKGIEGIYVLQEIERYTDIMETIGNRSDQFSTGGIPTRDLEDIVAGGKRAEAAQARLSHSSIHASLVNFIRSVEQGKKDFEHSKRGAQNAKALLQFLKKSTQLLPEAITTAEASLQITRELASISQQSRNIAEQSFSNAQKALFKLRKHKKFFQRRIRYLKKQRRKQ